MGLMNTDKARSILYDYCMGYGAIVKKCCPMVRDCSPRVKTSQALLPEAKPRAIILLRSSPEEPHAVFVLLHGQPPISLSC